MSFVVFLNTPHSTIIGGNREAKVALAIVLGHILYNSQHVTKCKVIIKSCLDFVHQRIGYTGELIRHILAKY